jgi:DNA polymerase (family 10)
MENKEISKKFKLLGQLMELNEENSFKIKTINNASFKIDKLPFKLKDKPLNELESIDGIGKSTASKIIELLTVGHIAELDAFITNTPEGILEMMTIKGLGPKKVKIIWDELSIENVGELYYACNENRLIEAKGFGFKTQEEIKKAIEFKMANAGRFLYAKIEKTAKDYQSQFAKALKDIDKNGEVLITGAFRRKCEIIDSLTFLMVSDQPITSIANLFSAEIFEISITENTIDLKDHSGLIISIYVCGLEEKAFKLFETTGCDEHVAKVKELLKGKTQFTSEEELYKTAGMELIAPELRENGNEIEKALKNDIPKLIEFSDLKGVLHNHSTWSDGINSLKEMAFYCKDVLKLEYLGISDHSKTAVYASGLSIESVLRQHEEIDSLNKELAPFKIFK